MKINTMGKYILEGKSIKEVDDLIQWGKWWETADRTVARTVLTPVNKVVAFLFRKEKVLISTVFLGIDHSLFLSPPGDPVLFETMVFKDSSCDDLETCRYCTWDEAEIGHADVVKRWKKGFCFMDLMRAEDVPGEE